MTNALIRGAIGAGASVLVLGCFAPAAEQIRRSVKPMGNGRYIVFYFGRPLERQYGTDRTIAVPKYMEAEGITPPECVHGVTILNSMDTEGGGGQSIVRCKE